MTDILKTWPADIVLVVGDGPLHPFDQNFEVTWCHDRIGDADVKYVRHDLVDAMRADLDTARSNWEACAEELRQADARIAELEEVAATARRLLTVLRCEDAAEAAQPCGDCTAQDREPFERAQEDRRQVMVALAGKLAAMERAQ